MAEGFRLLCAAKGNDPWRVFLRYQAQAERNYRRALEEFERLKALRNELPNEPIVEAQLVEDNSIPRSNQILSRDPDRVVRVCRRQEAVLQTPDPELRLHSPQRGNGLESPSHPRSLRSC
jgi:hypothetical protein